MEILFSACNRIEYGIGFWEEIDGVGRFSVGKVGDGHADYEEAVALILSCLHSSWILVRRRGRWRLWHAHPWSFQRLGFWMIVG